VLTSSLSISGVILQVSSASAAQFTVGRIVTYGMTGMAIVAVPIYQSETSPRALRGMFGSAIQFMIVLGQLIATLVTLGTHHLHDAAAWQVPVGLQLLLPTVILALLPLLPESPRWLLCRGRRDEAVASLRRLRPSAVPDDQVYLEIEAIAHAHEKEMMRRASWAEVFDESNRVRTLVAVLAMFGQQITGQAFPSQYGVVFYQSQGFRDRAFLFGVLSNVISLCAVVITWFYVDVVGRRPVLLGGGFLMGAFLFVLGAMGTVGKENLNSAENGLVVASIMGFSFFYNLSWAPM
jgi:MFS family permease